METEAILAVLYFILSSSFGIYFNAFIAVVSYRTWLHDGSHHPQGLLLFSIGFSSLIFQGLQIFFYISYYFWTEAFALFSVCMLFFRCLLTFCVFFSLCQTSWLCSFYCIKLVSFQHWIIQVLKSRLPIILPWIMAGTLVITTMGVVLLLCLTFVSVPLDYTGNSTFCRSINESYIPYIENIFDGFNILIALPFTLIMVSLSCTVSTLVQHVQRVQGSLMLDKSHLEAHIDAAKTMIVLLALNTSFYVSLVLILWDVVTYPWSWICIVLFCSFWPLQALTLIFRTKKLHRSFIWCLQKRGSEIV
ncbi:hypothetical protein GDO81_025940 [Engystomops pustulosus]|uniref:Taste receptor type 2 n=1 Tax=Engystomops pustulosus TaxID=76066 RepID=A0AAV6ZLI3_ENGPU|nr:hypothetical protein GDO81_025940 [Engystomops pustulosus]